MVTENSMTTIRSSEISSADTVTDRRNDSTSSGTADVSHEETSLMASIVPTRGVHAITFRYPLPHVSGNTW